MQYTAISVIGRGSFGKVYKVHFRNKICALKEIKIDMNLGIPNSAYREIKLLKSTNHPNFIHVYDICHKDHKLLMFLEYMPFDLRALIDKTELKHAQIRSYTYQLLCALDHLHQRHFVHRDLKPSNILIDFDGQLKLADFGTAREIDGKMTKQVCSLWYRAPELLLGSTDYDNKVDVFSFACLLIEMHTAKIAFRGKSDIDQASTLVRLFGKPETVYQWSHMFKDVEHSNSWCERVRDLFEKHVDPDLMELLTESLQMDAPKRISAGDALKLNVWKDYELEHIAPNIGDMHEMEHIPLDEHSKSHTKHRNNGF